MIYTVIADISSFDFEKAIAAFECCEDAAEIKKNIEAPLSSGKYPAPPLRPEILEHIKDASNERFRKERCGAYILLTTVVRNVLGFMPQLLFSQNGKPYFDAKYGVYFSVTHTDNMVAVSVSDKCCVGVDAEIEISDDRAARLESRFFSGLSISVRSLDVIYSFGKIIGLGETIIVDSADKDFLSISVADKQVFKVDQNDSFSARWTLYEASMKSGGGGFTSLPCLEILLLETKADLIKIVTKGSPHFVTTAIS